MGWPDPFDFVREKKYIKPNALRKIIQEINQKPFRLIEAIFAAIVFIPIVMIIFEHFYLGWSEWALWTGFGAVKLNENGPVQNKTLWDWMQLFFMPLILALLTVWFNSRSSYLDQERNIDQQREAILRSSIEEISDLFLRIAGSVPILENNILLRTKILTALRLLDGNRKGVFIQFLHETGFLRGTEILIDLYGADLNNIYLFGAQLLEVNLKGCFIMNSCFENSFLRASDFSRSNLDNSNFENAYLRLVNFNFSELCYCNFKKADARDAKFSCANLSRADFRKSVLYDSDFSFTNLTGANFSDADLFGANLEDAHWDNVCFKNATMPDGKKYNPKIHSQEKLTNIVPK